MMILPPCRNHEERIETLEHLLTELALSIAAIRERDVANAESHLALTKGIVTLLEQRQGEQVPGIPSPDLEPYHR